MSNNNGGNRQYPMHCKYDEGHGEFANGLTLRHHYNEAHVGEYVPPVRPIVTCECGKTMTRPSFYSHRKGMHNDDRTVTFTYTAADRIMRSPSVSKGVRGTCTLCGVSLIRDGVAKHLRNRHNLHGVVPVDYWQADGSNVVAISPPSLHHPSMQRPAEDHVVPDEVEMEPMTADDIVLPAITALAMPGSVVPVSAMAALFLWRDQTAAMLTTISGKV